VKYFLHYQMLSGTGSRACETVDEAVESYREIRAAGGSVFDIRDASGQRYSIDDLITGAQSARRPKDPSEPEV
jgi:hypothetical protein